MNVTASDTDRTYEDAMRLEGALGQFDGLSLYRAGSCARLHPRIETVVHDWGSFTTFSTRPEQRAVQRELETHQQATAAQWSRARETSP